MGTLEKALKRLYSKPKDYTYSEAKSLLQHFGFEENNKGKTSGSKVKFYRKSDKKMTMLHKPHPGNIMKPYMVEDLIDFIVELGVIDE